MYRPRLVDFIFTLLWREDEGSYYRLGIFLLSKTAPIIYARYLLFTISYPYTAQRNNRKLSLPPLCIVLCLNVTMTVIHLLRKTTRLQFMRGSFLLWCRCLYSARHFQPIVQTIPHRLMSKPRRYPFPTSGFLLLHALGLLSTLNRKMPI